MNNYFFTSNLFTGNPKRILPLLCTTLLALFVLSGCSIFGAPTELDDTKGWQADRIYQEGEDRMTDKDYDKAIGYFQKLESRFPHGKYAAQAQLEIAYAQYKKQDPVSCVAAAERFIKLHPNHPNVDYAYYLKGLATFNERGFVEKYTAQEISDRDPKTLKTNKAKSVVHKSGKIRLVLLVKKYLFKVKNLIHH